jgi:hypothetical protein
LLLLILVGFRAQERLRQAAGNGKLKDHQTCAGTAGDYSTTFAADGKGRGHIHPAYPVTTRDARMEEDSSGPRLEKGKQMQVGASALG